MRADQRPDRLDRTRGIHVVKPHYLGDELASRSDSATRADRLAGGPFELLDPVAAADRDRDEAIGAEGREEDLEIFRTAERALGDDRKLLVDPAVDDERLPHHPRRVGGKGPHFDIAHVDAVLGPDRGSERQQ